MREWIKAKETRGVRNVQKRRDFERKMGNVTCRELGDYWLTFLQPVWTWDSAQAPGPCALRLQTGTTLEDKPFAVWAPFSLCRAGGASATRERSLLNVELRDE